MKSNTPDRTGCVVFLFVWFCIIQLVAGYSAPSLNRILYPQPIDLLVLAFIPVGAFQAAGLARTGMLFTVYGCLASTVFWLHYTRSGTAQWAMPIWGGSALWRVFAVTSVVTVVLVVACKFSAALRWRWDKRIRYPPGHCQECGYNLEGNVTGRCSECGAKIEGEQ